MTILRHLALYCDSCDQSVTSDLGLYGAVELREMAQADGWKRERRRAANGKIRYYDICEVCR